MKNETEMKIIKETDDSFNRTDVRYDTLGDFTVLESLWLH